LIIFGQFVLAFELRVSAVIPLAFVGATVSDAFRVLLGEGKA